MGTKETAEKARMGRRDLWSPEKDMLLIKLLTEHFTIGAAAKFMDITRNAAIGRVTRLRQNGLMNNNLGRTIGRPPLARIVKPPKAEAPRPAPIPRPPEPEIEPLEPPERDELPTEAELREAHLRALYMATTHDQCKYLHGDYAPYEPCQAKAVEGYSYCEFHKEKCIKTIKEHNAEKALRNSKLQTMRTAKIKLPSILEKKRAYG